MAEQPESCDYARGREQGRVDERLRHHSEHLAAINGSIERSAAAIERLEELVEKLHEEAQLREERQAVMAATLEREQKVRQTVDDRRFARLQAVVVIFIGAMGLVVTIVLALTH